jgi:hypothetical protein
MAINRKGYTSLIESVQETVSQSVNEATRSKAMKTYRMKKAGKASDEQLHQASLKSDISRLRRGGASSTTLKNAAAAARRGFNYEQNPYDDDDDSGTIHPDSYNPKHEIDAEYQFQLRSRRSRKAARAAGKAVPSLREARWATGAALTNQLNNMQNNAPTASDSGKGKVRTRKNPLSRTSGGTSSTSTSSSPKAPKGPSASGASSVVSEDWDILDEILAEGIELYGEDGLAEILADFAETGEISDELALLLSDE